MSKPIGCCGRSAIRSPAAFSVTSIRARTVRGVSDLIKQGIVLTTNDVDYEFTKLNDIEARVMVTLTYCLDC